MLVQHARVQTRVHALARAARGEGPAAAHERVEDGHRGGALMILPSARALEREHDVRRGRVAADAVIAADVPRRDRRLPLRLGERRQQRLREGDELRVRATRGGEHEPRRDVVVGDEIFQRGGVQSRQRRRRRDERLPKPALERGRVQRLHDERARVFRHLLHLLLELRGDGVHLVIREFRVERRVREKFHRLRVVPYERTSGWIGVERRRGWGLKAARVGRRDAPAKVLKDRRSQRRRGRTGTSVRRTRLGQVRLEAVDRVSHLLPARVREQVRADHLRLAREAERASVRGRPERAPLEEMRRAGRVPRDLVLGARADVQADRERRPRRVLRRDRRAVAQDGDVRRRRGRGVRRRVRDREARERRVHRRRGGRGRASEDRAQDRRLARGWGRQRGERHGRGGGRADAARRRADRVREDHGGSALLCFPACAVAEDGARPARPWSAREGARRLRPVRDRTIDRAYQKQTGPFTGPLYFWPKPWP
eukprot:31147-Pelagococcus_subviridis.AAC.2